MSYKKWWTCSSLSQTLFCFFYWQTWRPSVVRGKHHRPQKRFYQEDQVKQAEQQTEMYGCRSQSRASHHKSHVGEWGSFVVCTRQARTLSLLAFTDCSPGLLHSYFSGGVPAMNPSSLGFSVQASISARHCVDIPPVWVLPTQDLQTAPEQTAWNTPESLLCSGSLVCF